MKHWRRPTEWQVFSIIFFGSLVIFVVLGVLALIGPNMVGPHIGGKLAGDPQVSCDQRISGNVHLNVTHTLYAGKINGVQIDPNNWRDGPFAFEYPGSYTVIVPYMDYQISYDNGQSWEVFWRYESWLYNEVEPRCDGFGKRDAMHFWVWSWHGAAVTHDGGHQWLTHQQPIFDVGYEQIDFMDSNTGYIERVDDTKLITTDGGATWHEEPAS
jgi:hypothetical protein